MDDIKIYDQAVIDFRTKLKPNKMPLQSWDFHSSFFSELSNAIADARNLNILASENKWNTDFDFLSELENDTVIVVTNPEIEIVFASQNIINMNGYLPEEVIGKSPKMFQGDNPDELISRTIRLSIDKRRPFEATVVNFHKNGTAYDCHIKGFPVFDKDQKLLHFVAFERVA